MAEFLFGTYDTYQKICEGRDMDSRMSKYVEHIKQKIINTLGDKKTMQEIYGNCLRLEEFECFNSFLKVDEPEGYLFGRSVSELYLPPESISKIVEAVLLEDQNHVLPLELYEDVIDQCMVWLLRKEFPGPARFRENIIRHLKNNYKGRDLFLHRACRVGKWNQNSPTAGVEVFKALLSQGCNEDVNGRDSRGRTPLHFAVSKGMDLRGIMLLLQAGADKGAVNNKGQPVLHSALAHRASYAVIMALLGNASSKGADPNAKNKNGQNAAHVAILRGASDDVIMALVQYGANLKWADHNGVTPFHFAVEKRASLRVIKTFLRQGIHPTDGLDVGCTPYEVATRLYAEMDGLHIDHDIDLLTVFEEHIDCCAHCQQRHGNAPFVRGQHPEDLTGEHLHRET